MERTSQKSCGIEDTIGEHTRCILNSVQETCCPDADNLNDSRLPFCAENLQTLRPKGVDNPALIKALCNAQWRSCPTEPLRDGQFKRERISPDVEEERLGISQFSELWEIKIHPAHNRLPKAIPPSHDHINPLVLKTYNRFEAKIHHENEIEAFTKIRDAASHPRRIEIYGGFKQGDTHNILLEYADPKALQSYVDENCTKGQTNPEISSPCWQDLLKSPPCYCGKRGFPGHPGDLGPPPEVSPLWAHPAFPWSFGYILSLLVVVLEATASLISAVVISNYDIQSSKVDSSMVAHSGASTGSYNSQTRLPMLLGEKGNGRGAESRFELPGVVWFPHFVQTPPPEVFGVACISYSLTTLILYRLCRRNKYCKFTMLVGIVSWILVRLQSSMMDGESLHGPSVYLIPLVVCMSLISSAISHSLHRWLSGTRDPERCFVGHGLTNQDVEFNDKMLPTDFKVDMLEDNSQLRGVEKSDPMTNCCGEDTTQRRDGNKGGHYISSEARGTLPSWQDGWSPHHTKATR